MVWAIVIVAVAALVMYFRQQAIKQQSRDRIAGMMWEIADRRTNSVIEPDLEFAAIGYTLVANLRRNPSNKIDLHELEEAHAITLLKEGCTPEQALSARWGGAYAIVDPLYQYDDAIASYKKTAKEQGVPYNDSDESVRQMYKAAAFMVMTLAHNADPFEYGRFLKFIGINNSYTPIDLHTDQQLERRKNDIDQRLKAFKR